LTYSYDDKHCITLPYRKEKGHTHVHWRADGDGFPWCLLKQYPSPAVSKIR